MTVQTLNICCTTLYLTIFLVFTPAFQPLSIIIPNAFALSTSFPVQEIRDDALDWINMTTKQHTRNGDPSTDMLSMDYYSDQKFLNATLWLYFPFKDRTPR